MTDPDPTTAPRRRSAIGKIAYDAYAAKVPAPQPLPAWHELTDEVRDAWSDAACAVREDTLSVHPKAASEKP